MTFIIEGPVVHACGWGSDGGAFPEGAGCPKCGEPIFVDSLTKYPEKPPSLARSSEWPPSITIGAATEYISEIETIQELSSVLAIETAGKNRKRVLAAIDARGIELTATEEREEPPVGGSSS